MEVSPTYERYLRQREYMDKSYGSPPADFQNQLRYYSNRSPRHARSGSPAYTRMNPSHKMAWHTPEGRKCGGSPNYGEICGRGYYFVEGVFLNPENPFNY